MAVCAFRVADMVVFPVGRHGCQPTAKALQTENKTKIRLSCFFSHFFSSVSPWRSNPLFSSIAYYDVFPPPLPSSSLPSKPLSLPESSAAYHGIGFLRRHAWHMTATYLLQCSRKQDFSLLPSSDTFYAWLQYHESQLPSASYMIRHTPMTQPHMHQFMSDQRCFSIYATDIHYNRWSRSYALILCLKPAEIKPSSTINPRSPVWSHFMPSS